MEKRPGRLSANPGLVRTFTETDSETLTEPERGLHLSHPSPAENLSFGFMLDDPVNGSCYVSFLHYSVFHSGGDAPPLIVGRMSGLVWGH